MQLKTTEEVCLDDEKICGMGFRTRPNHQNQAVEMAAERNSFPRRWDPCIIGFDLKIIWEMSVKVSGNSDIDVTVICVEGATQNSGNNTFIDASPTDACSTASNPLSGLAEPSNADDICLDTDYDLSGNSGTATLLPGVYCNGIKISGKRLIPAEPGLTTCWVCGCHRQDVRLMFCHAQPLERRPPDVPRRLQIVQLLSDEAS